VSGDPSDFAAQAACEVRPDAPAMASSSNIVKGNGRVPQERHTSWSLHQHDSATTLEGIMDTAKSDSFGPDVKMLNQQTLREFGMAAKRAGSVTSGLASRETSPERGGSIASYRASSRPGTAQTYSAAEIKKQYAGKFSHPSLACSDIDTNLDQTCY